MDRRQHSLFLRRLRKGGDGDTRGQNRAEKENELLGVPVHARHSILRSVPVNAPQSSDLPRGVSERAHDRHFTQNGQ